MQSMPFEQVYERFNTDPADDLDGARAAEGLHFVVPRLNLSTLDGDGFSGRVLLPESAGAALRENLVDASFGIPRVLNDDGNIDGTDHAADKILLPVRVQVQWSGVYGDRTAEFMTVLGDRQRCEPGPGTRCWRWRSST